MIAYVVNYKNIRMEFDNFEQNFCMRFLKSSSFNTQIAKFIYARAENKEKFKINGHKIFEK